MDMTVLQQISYGIYAIGAVKEEKPTGCIVNTLIQLTAEEKPLIAISMNKKNHTYAILKESGRFSVSILSEETPPEVIGRLGFMSGRDKEKFVGLRYMYLDELPVVKENACGYLVADVVGMTDAGTHEIVIGRVTNTRKDMGQIPMTYKYYQEVIKGKAPKNAPTYRG